MEQGTPEWLAARAGKVTASRVSDVVARTKSGYSASRANYMAELICERLTGARTDSFVSSSMAWGTSTEPEARTAYQLQTGSIVEQVGFVEHPSIPMAGASPDGLVDDTGLLEIKCPNTATHIDTLLSDVHPAKYYDQMQWQMACTGRQWCDFVSYDPRMPERMRLAIRLVPRDDERISVLEAEVIKFLKELDENLAELNSRYSEG